MTFRSEKRGLPPLDDERLDRLALFYVGRYATTRARLRTYLQRKLKERGWHGSAAPDVERLVERLAGLGYVDDRAFASARSASLLRRGYGERRVRQALRAAGVEEADSAALHENMADAALEAAFRLARRRRLGPFSTKPDDPTMRRKAFAAIVRAGHPPDIARKVLDASAAELPDWDSA